MTRVILSFLIFFSVSGSALQARDLIKEADDMYRSLGANEPEKIPVTLRLADLLFDAAIEIDSDEKTANTERATADAYRDRALSLYKDVVPKINAESALRVKFQMARIYMFKAQMAPAMALWRQIVDSKGNPRLRREAALHWAEQLELASNNASIREARELYVKSLPLADTDTLKAYVNYRLAWTEYRLGDPAKATVNLKTALELTVDKERDELLRDMILFMSRDEKSAKDQLAAVEELEKKYSRTGYQAQLADAYMVADRKADYVYALTALNAREPNLERAVNILDAAHDSLSRERVAEELKNVVNLRRSGVTFKDANAEKRAKDKLFRLVHLWDGHRRAGREAYANLLADGVGAMIVLFPRSEETSTAMSGWLAAEKNPKVQLERVDSWLGLAREVKNRPLEIRLTQNKLELARQIKDWSMVVVVTKDLETLTAEQARPVRYQRAKALYELKDYASALPVFLDLAREKSDGKDDFKKLSQDLALDILAIQKDYPQIERLTAEWKKVGGARATEMSQIGENAQFENAVLAQNGESLTTFTQFCLEKKYLPKSCDNAKALAAKLRNQATLIVVLKAMGDETELARQLEVAGRFGESARLLEKNTKKPDRMTSLKIALLYELQGELHERDRVLTGLVKQLRGQKMTDKEQSLIYLTLRDAGLINETALTLAWSEDLKMKIASDIYEKSHSSTAKGMLAKYCGPAGAGWERVKLEDMRELNARQAKIKFTGARSKTKFEERVSLLKTLGQKANCFKAGATPELTKAVLQKIAEAYQDFAGQIRETPIPEGLDADTLKEVQNQIDTMASPFETQSEKWQATADEIAAIVPTDSSWDFTISEGESEKVAPLVFNWQPLLKDIEKEPFSVAHFQDLKNHFEGEKRARLSAYVSGRIEDMKEEVK